MTKSAKSPRSGNIHDPSTEHGGGSNVSFDRVSAAPSSTVTSSFKRSETINSYGKRSAKSYGKLERRFSMSPKVSIAESPTNRLERIGSERFDASARSDSIGVYHNLPIGEHLVTNIRRSTIWPKELKDEEHVESIDPDEESRRWRRELEISLRMYPRNTWGPTTKWGYLDELPDSGEFKQKDHFKKNNISNHDKMTKERIATRDIGFKRNWTRYKDLTHQWEDTIEAHKSLSYGKVEEQYARNAEKMLHAQNDRRLAKIKSQDERWRSNKTCMEFTRLERRESEYLAKIENEAQLRVNPGSQKIKSSVNYNILAPQQRTADELFALKAKRWRAMMRSLRLQSKQSGARMYDVVTWKPQKPCCVPPPKPEPSDLPIENQNISSERRPSPARPRNMLHSMDTVDDVPISATQDNRTNW